MIEKTKKHNQAKVAKTIARSAIMPVIIRNVPAGFDWGWYSREDPRMHVQTVDGPHRYKVWLEEQGKRVFQSEGKIPRRIPRRVLNALQKELIDQRQLIENKWVRLMLDQGWLNLYVALPHVTLVAYRNHPGKFCREIDMRT